MNVLCGALNALDRKPPAERQYSRVSDLRVVVYGRVAPKGGGSSAGWRRAQQSNIIDGSRAPVG